MLNRTQAPHFKTIEKVDIQEAASFKLDNGIPVYTIDAGSQELTRIEFIFKAGTFWQDAPLNAITANSLIENGTAKYSANKLSDSIDFYGSFFETSCGYDFSSLALFSLNKHLESTLVFVEDLIKNAIYPQEEITTYLANKKQKHLVNLQKVNSVARHRFSELLFGEKHPYGIQAKTEHYDNLQRESIVNFYKKHYHHANCTIMVAGKLPANLAQILNKHFGAEKWGSATEIKKLYPNTQNNLQRENLVEKKDAVQSAIRIGCRLFNKTHENYFAFQVLNTVLGGYFGSRLMANIREDKGYTYGIGSGLSSLVNDGFFYISTEVGADVTKSALDEIYKEIEILQNDLVTESELETVKNYILGQFLRSVEGPFALADKYRGIWEFGLGYDYYSRYFGAVQTANPRQLRDLAIKYLKKTDLIELVVGKK
ncbi:MAG TPA: pitrilysin family protein [Bacteroidia bacterium]|jgi:zinc protease|nr:pitrilysin family protein [Bacteroidia bacterium]